MSTMRTSRHPLHRRRSLFLFAALFGVVGLNFFLRLQNTHSSEQQATQDSKVALLFLTRGELPHEATWRAFFENAGKTVPRTAELAVCSNSAQLAETLHDQCEAMNNATGDPIEAQQLFSVYVHAPPSFAGYPNSSLWANSRISQSIHVSWGDHSISAATRALLAAALQDRRNQRFVLVSESDIPLFNPLTFYQQLMYEQRSRVNACPGGIDHMPRRWSDKMTTEHMNASHWRKSSQWFTLQRRHAAVVVQDAEVYDSFEKYCHYGVDPETGLVRDCISDEHYIPTLMAVHGFGEEEMDCSSWGVAALDWGHGGAHPKSFNPQEISAELIHGLRGMPREAAAQSQWSAHQQFIHCSRLASIRTGSGSAACKADVGKSSAAAAGGYQPMPESPRLTARKFPAESAAAVEQLVDVCEDEVGMGLLSGKPCR